MRAKNRRVNRRFGAIIYRDNPILVIPGGELEFHSSSTHNFLNGLSRHDDNVKSKVDILHGATFNHSTIKRDDIIEVTDSEINDLLLDEQLGTNFRAEAHDLLNMKPVRPKKNW